MAYIKSVEEQIQAAMARGEFDNLPGAGKPLDLSENPYTPEELRLGYKLLKDAGFAPLWITLQKEIEADLAALGQIERQYRQLVSEGAAESMLARLKATYRERLLEINAKIKQFNLMVPVANLQKRLFDVEQQMQELAIWPLT